MTTPLRPDKLRLDFVDSDDDRYRRDFYETLAQRRWKTGRTWILVDGPSGVASIRIDIDGSGRTAIGGIPLQSFRQIVAYGAAYLGWKIAGADTPLTRIESEDDSVIAIPDAEQAWRVRLSPQVPGDLRIALADLVLCARALAMGPHSKARADKARRAIGVAVEALRQITGERLGVSDTDPAWQAIQAWLDQQVAAGRMRKARRTVSIEFDAYEPA